MPKAEMKTLIALFICSFYSVSAFAWQGFNMDTGTIIDVNIGTSQAQVTMGNVTYFDFDTGEEKLGYLNMYENNMGLIIDLDTGELIRVRMDGRR